MSKRVEALRKHTFTVKIIASLLLCFLAYIPESQAHVKWFTDGSYADRPLKFGEVLEGRFFYSLFALCMVTVLFGVWLDSRINKASWYKRVDGWLEMRKQYAPLVLRGAAAIVLILSWQSNAMIVPTIPVPAHYEWLGWFQFVCAFLLLIPKTVPLGGLGIVFIWFIGNITLHPFHMLDYLMFAGCGLYLIFSSFKSVKWNDFGLVLLYLTVGFSLSWVALEKFVYPNWSMFLIKEHPKLAMGLNFDFFLKSVGYVEFGLGFLLLVCLLQRPLAIIITIVFFITSTVFGKIEIIGHTMIHGALIVFLLQGPGTYYIRLREWIGNIWKRIGFTTITFIALFSVLLVSYTNLAENKYDKKQASLQAKPEHQATKIEMAGYPKTEIPGIWMEIIPDAQSGYNIHFNTVNFNFTPDHVNSGYVMGEGYAELYLNGTQMGRVYGNWYHIDGLPPGNNEVMVTLKSNDHSEYCIRGTPISSRENVYVEKK
ncbi:MAG: hypothetical protein R2794_03545 [Chitinophagales bacterium]